MSLVVGITGNHTMKLMGKMKEEVMVLTDSGATHNFIAAELVEKLNFPIQSTETFQVSLGDCYKVRGGEPCRVEMQGIELQQTFHVFDMGGTNIVLGIEWLKSLRVTPLLPKLLFR